ncbi:lytic transglycosylase domain-containing protein [Terriglobus albidus]|uniref:lytic transglycosylase domain-containing protein n=1 Tax=Terriglobus albidus TaxID=1592106 RepID=UPI0021E00B4A|nr:transglycosylase SLT domain-containing protein [Terriglobus albidus]
MFVRVLSLCLLSATAFAAEHITLRTGFTLDCVRREAAAEPGRVRLYTSEQSYLEVPQEAIAQAEFFELPSPSIRTELKETVTKDETSLERAAAFSLRKTPIDAEALHDTRRENALTASELHQLLASAGAAHRVDADLLAAVVRAESNNQPAAVSRAGAQGLMQLMPGTARELGVHNSFHPGENVNGGSAYLDALLTRYHDNMAMALAAYNAGPGAVDRYHGIPPYRETRAYVARVIREFNRRKLEAETRNATAQAQAQ